jgi:hypothetical protein
VIYQDPLAYLLGLEGIALLDAWAGDHDRAARLALPAARRLRNAAATSTQAATATQPPRARGLGRPADGGQAAMTPEVKAR